MSTWTSIETRVDNFHGHASFITVRLFSSGMIPVDWEESSILNLYKGKSEALDCGNYCGLKLTDQVIKLLEQVLDSSICQMVNIHEMQFAFVPDRSTSDAIFIVHQLQEKYMATANKWLYFAFFDLEKAFDLVPRKVLWLALMSLGVDEWAVHVTRTSSGPGVSASLSPLTADQWLKWIFKAPSLMWRLLSAIWVT